MIIYVTGDLLKSDAECLVNTVNCEGYMGKGIAYQFKQAYPKNNLDYVKACKNGTLSIGNLHFYREEDKIIINFPTKDKWRANSKMEYIEKGLDALIVLIKNLNIKSIAIPPLGSGNGGLIWSDVKVMIEKKMKQISEDIKIYIYEPSMNYIAKPISEPKLSLSALILMQIKLNLKKFDKIRLQKTAYLFDNFNENKYFKFKKDKYGPYDYSIDIISKKIKEFQQYHNAKDTQEAYEIAYRKLTSDKIDSSLNQYMPFIYLATEYVNKINTNHELECIATILYIIETNKSLPESEIISEFKNWSEDKANRFKEDDINSSIQFLLKYGFIEKTLIGYSLPNIKKVI